MRTITSRANVNLAAVNYHFGSKAQLYQAVFQRRVAPMNRERIQALESLERKAGDTPLELDDILRAFVEPALKASMNPKQGAPISSDYWEEHMPNRDRRCTISCR